MFKQMKIKGSIILIWHCKRKQKNSYLIFFLFHPKHPRMNHHQNTPQIRIFPCFSVRLPARGAAFPHPAYIRVEWGERPAICCGRSLRQSQIGRERRADRVPLVDQGKSGGYNVVLNKPARDGIGFPSQLPIR